jgi:predicted Zn finger-like uncharacterized protein
MIVTCPSCSTRYKMDPTRFGSLGRRVRCAKCTHVWLQMPPDDLPKPVLPPEPPPVPADVPDDVPRVVSPALVQAARDETRRALLQERELREELGPLAEPEPARGLRAGWLVLVMVVTTLAIGGILAHDAVVRAWPPAERLYALVGIDAARLGEGLTIKVVEHRRDVEGSNAVLIIKGEVTNNSDGVRDVPRLKASLRSHGGDELSSWTFATAQARLLPGETAPFVTRIENPSTDASALNIDFTASGR